MEIVNYTRYSTEDLQVLIRTVEAFSGFSSWRPSIAQLVFKEFDPKNAYITTRSHRWNATAPKEKRYVSKTRWSDLTAVGLLVPGKIYENPLEALSQGDGEVAPADMVAKIVETLIGRANVAPYNAKVSRENMCLLLMVMMRDPCVSDDAAGGQRVGHGIREVVRVVLLSEALVDPVDVGRDDLVADLLAVVQSDGQQELCVGEHFPEGDVTHVRPPFRWR